MSGLPSRALALVYPCRCISCGDPAPGRSMCPDCSHTLLPIEGPTCRTCGRFLEAGDPGGPSLERCGSCALHPGPLDQVRAGYEYGEALARAIIRMKHGNRAGLGAPLAELLLERFPEAPEPGSQLLVPIPVHSLTLLRRGFNQAELLSRRLSRAWNIPTAALLSRVRHTGSQAGLTREERQKNVQGAFRVKSDPGTRDRTVILVDDVLTTGATMTEAALTLRDQGFTRVEALVLAQVMG